ncbi:hypothetical protein DRJ16_00970 [Candidatus Woesearchaeota archaeon]|nr:MAG: hypothetical protein DRJ16_00970 [Candidatus Woesearchaeota archaeon]
MLKLNTRLISITAVFTALVTLATAALQISIPETKGYFNIGEIIIYTAALLFGPIVGAIAGGVGAALADIITGYYIYAPATLIIKGIEGYVVGYLVRKLPRIKNTLSNVFVNASLLIAFTGIWMSLYSGTMTFSLTLGTWEILTLNASSIAIYILIIIVFIITALILTKMLESSTLVLSTLTGGAIMVLGYYLYESLILNVVALAEVPFNIGQAVIGTMGAIPIYTALRKMLKQYKVPLFD